MALTTRAWESLVGAEGCRVRAVRAGACGRVWKVREKAKGCGGNPVFKNWGSWSRRDE